MKFSKLCSLAAAAYIAAGLISTATAADLEAGKQEFRKCAICHTLEEGVNRVGPSLYGVLKRAPGTLSSYHYSKAMTDYGSDGKLWTEQRLIDYLKSPRTVVPGTKMGFAGIPGLEAREDLVAYLKSAGAE